MRVDVNAKKPYLQQLKFVKPRMQGYAPRKNLKEIVQDIQGVDLTRRWFGLLPMLPCRKKHFNL